MVWAKQWFGDEGSPQLRSETSTDTLPMRVAGYAEGFRFPVGLDSGPSTASTMSSDRIADRREAPARARTPRSLIAPLAGSGTQGR